MTINNRKKFAPACADGTSIRWNPLKEIRKFTLHDVADVQNIINIFYKGSSLGNFYNPSAKSVCDLLAAVALHLVYVYEDASFSGMADFLSDPTWDCEKQIFSEMMQASHDPELKMMWKDSLGRPTPRHPMIEKIGKRMFHLADFQRTALWVSACSTLSLFLDPIVAKNTNVSDFVLRDLMSENNTNMSIEYHVNAIDKDRLSALTNLFNDYSGALGQPLTVEQHDL